MQRDKNIFNTNLIYFILITLFCCVRILWATNAMSFLGDSGDYVFTIVVQIFIMFLLPLVMFTKMKKQKYRTTFKDFSFKKINSKSFFLSIFIGILVFVLNIFVASFFGFILSMFGYSPIYSTRIIDSSWITFLLEVVFVAVLPGFCEEFAHRGMLLKGYYSLGFKRAIIYSSILFGLMHLNVSQFFYATVIGLVLASITLLTGSIFPAMIIHFINNFINKYISFAEVRDLPFGNVYSVLQNFMAKNGALFSIILISVVVCILVWLLFKCIIKIFKINAIGSINEFTNKMSMIQLREKVLEGIELDEKDNPTQNGKFIVPIELLGIPMKPIVSPSKLDNLFFYSSLLLGGLVTFFTFIWGVI